MVRGIPEGYPWASIYVLYIYSAAVETEHEHLGSNRRLCIVPPKCKLCYWGLTSSMYQN